MDTTVNFYAAKKLLERLRPFFVERFDLKIDPHLDEFYLYSVYYEVNLKEDQKNALQGFLETEFDLSGLIDIAKLTSFSLNDAVKAIIARKLEVKNKKTVYDGRSRIRLWFELGQNPSSYFDIKHVWKIRSLATGRMTSFSDLNLFTTQALRGRVPMEDLEAFSRELFMRLQKGSLFIFDTLLCKVGEDYGFLHSPTDENILTMERFSAGSIDRKEFDVNRFYHPLPDPFKGLHAPITLSLKEVIGVDNALPYLQQLLQTDDEMGTIMNRLETTFRMAKHLIFLRFPGQRTEPTDYIVTVSRWKNPVRLLIDLSTESYQRLKCRSCVTTPF